jgi:serine/threonine protein kinase
VLRPGGILAGKYQVGRLLGRGGFGATYLAWDMNLQVRVAIKEFLPRQLAARTSGGMRVSAYTGGQEGFNLGLQQFLSEARNLAQFRDHAGIISVLDFFPENGTGYMVMEYLDGCTLEHHLRSLGHLDTKVVLQLLVPVADALRACHAAGLIHRDVSPDNIFVTADGRVKLLDFGAARFAIGSRSTNLSVILKEGYAPFEQYQRNGRQGPWTDIYALTGTLYRLLTDELPVAAPDRVAGTHLPTAAEKGVKISPALQALLDKGLAVRSEQRYQKVDDFLSDLQAMLGPTPPRPVPSFPRRWKRPVALTGSVGLVGVVGTFVVVWLYQTTTTPQTTLPPTASVAPPVFVPTPINPTKNEVATRPSMATQLPPPVASETNTDSTVSSIREYIRNGVQDQLQAMRKSKLASAADTALRKIRGGGTATGVVSDAIHTEEVVYRDAIAARDDSLNKYFAEVDWLAGHQSDAVDRAIQLEEDDASIPTMDQRKAEERAQIVSVLDQLKRDIGDRRQGHFVRQAAIDRLSAGGTR